MQKHKPPVPLQRKTNPVARHLSAASAQNKSVARRIAPSSGCGMDHPSQTKPRTPQRSAAPQCRFSEKQIRSTAHCAVGRLRDRLPFADKNLPNRNSYLRTTSAQEKHPTAQCAVLRCFIFAKAALSCRLPINTIHIIDKSDSINFRYQWDKIVSFFRLLTLQGRKV